MTGVVLRPGTRADREDLTALLAGLSPESAYQRFQTAIGIRPTRAVVDALLPDGVCGTALLAYVGDALVGHGVWIRVGASRVAEIAVLVADDHQQQGIGTELAAALLADAAARGISQVEVFSGTGNRAVHRMVARQAPGADRTRDGATVSYVFAVDRPRASRTGSPTTVSSGPRRPSAA